MLAILGASGKIGGATLKALLDRNLIPKNQIIALTSSQPNDEKFKSLASKGIQVRHATFDDPASWDTALEGVTKLFLVSSPRIWIDYDPVVPAPPGQGREKDHFVVLDAAQKAGVRHIYYTSLAFANPSKSNVMTAHERTEERLRKLEAEGVFDITILREGLYNESWPLYLGYFDEGSGDDRSEIVLADEGDFKISWTGIADLGLANAMILADEADKWEGRCVYLSRRAGSRSMREIAKAVGENLAVRTVNEEEHVTHYVQERGRSENAVKWWSATYAAIKDGECLIDDPTFDELMERVEVKATAVESTIASMLKK